MDLLLMALCISQNDHKYMQKDAHDISHTQGAVCWPLPPACFQHKCTKPLYATISLLLDIEKRIVQCRRLSGFRSKRTNECTAVSVHGLFTLRT